MIASSAYLFAAMAAISPVLGHMFITEPAPIPGTDSKPPLDPSGSNFPCQGFDLSTYSGDRIDMAVGSTQPFKWELGGGANTATHGGGSCQVSITYETDATALKDPANWKVIHSFIDGCPTNAPGNLASAIACATNGGSDCVNSYDFTIPEEVKDGDAFLAITWFNTIGNREMYMNCAAVTFSGGQDKINELPTLFVANLASINTCATVEREVVKFPNPGKYVTYQYGADGVSVYPVVEPATCAGVGASTGGGSSDGGSDTPTYGSPSSSASSSASATASSSASATASSSATNAPSSTAAAPTTSAPATSAYVPTTMSTATASATSTGAAFYPGEASSSTTSAATPTGTDSASGSCPAGQVPCSAEGFYCISSTSFGMCYNGCAVAQDVAGGTKCERSQIDFARRSYMPPQARRGLRLF